MTLQINKKEITVKKTILVTLGIKRGFASHPSRKKFHLGMIRMNAINKVLNKRFLKFSMTNDV